jgi:CheY-like chemotaxis protein
MKRILFVDDDPLVLRIYKDALTRQGFQVEPAQDALTASKILQGTAPDLMVVDLMMSKNQGVEILNLARSQPELAALPVIVFSNSYIEGTTREGEALGPQRALLKVRCTPSILLGVIQELLTAPVSGSIPQKSAPLPDLPRPSATKTQPDKSFASQLSGPNATEAAPIDTEFRAKAREQFLLKASATCAGLHTAFQAFARAKNDADRRVHLENLYRNVHFLAASAGLAECYPIARMASVFEAMLFEMTNKPSLQNPSVLRTIAQAVDFFDVLFQQARDTGRDLDPGARILVVDDDVLSNRLVVSTLRNAQLQAVSTEDPLEGLQRLTKEKYALVLLDIEMPAIDGLEFFKRLRELPGYRKTPVIYVTSHSGFESRAKIALSGGADLLAKPVFPMELAVKAMTHLLSGQLIGAK